MFVPVACSQCGKPFQVPEATVGKPTVCPWCNATVPALPVGAAATPPSTPEPEPLPLEDAPAPLPLPKPAPAKVAEPSVFAPPAPQPATPPRRFPWILASVLAVLSLVVAATATVGVKRYKQGHLVGWEWRAFTTPDKVCTIELLGRPVEDTETDANEKRYVSEGWYSGTVAWVGWRDLTQVQIQLAETKDAWQHFGGIFQPERDRLKLRYGGTITKDATTKFEDPLTHEIRIEHPGGRVVERIIVKPKASKVFYVGMAGKIDPDGPEVQRLFDSLRVTE